MADEQLGLSVRLIRYYQPEDDQQPMQTTPDIAIQLAIADEREIPFAQKLEDAMAFLKSRIH